MVKNPAPIAACLLAFCFVVVPDATSAQSRIWGHDNLFAWTVAPFDANDRTPEQRVQLLAALGFKSYAYSWRERHVPTFDAELAALKRRGIRLLGWNMLVYEVGDPPAIAALEAIKRHRMHPRLWVMQSFPEMRGRVGTLTDFLPKGFNLPTTKQARDALSEAERAQLREARKNFLLADFPKTPEEQQERVKREAQRIQAIVKVAAEYGCGVALYNHNGWFGMVENQLAIIERLHQLGVGDVGMVYNFSHARDEVHDDTRDFPALWKKIQGHVVAVNVTGMKWDGQLIYPSQGDSELEMMRTIESSGWRGPVGLIAEKGGDAQVTLQNYIRGLDWLAAELAEPGSGGPRPFPHE